MTYAELQINIDLLDKKDRLNLIKKNLPYFKTTNDKTFVVCEDGDCHLFDIDGNECCIDEVKTIKEFVHNYDRLTCIKIPDNVTSIGDYAFYNCTGLMSATIPNSVTSIGNYAFSRCYGLASVAIPKSVTSIGDWAFYGCRGLTSVAIPNSMTSIGKNAFYKCNELKELVFKDKTIEEVKSMDSYP